MCNDDETSLIHILPVLDSWTHRAAEYEADAIGVHLLAKACYDPDANITMLQKLQQVQDKQGVELPPELLSTHPLTQVGAGVGECEGGFCSRIDSVGQSAAWRQRWMGELPTSFMLRGLPSCCRSGSSGCMRCCRRRLRCGSRRAATCRMSSTW